jgi:ATP-binding cassette subfamily B protein
MTTANRDVSASPNPSTRASQRSTTTEARLKAFHEEGSLGKAYDSELLKRLWPFVKPHASHLGIAIGLLVLIAACNMFRPIIMGAVVRHAAGGDRDGLFRDGLILTGLVLSTQVLSFIELYQVQIAGARDGRHARDRVSLLPAAHAPLLRQDARRPTRHACHERRRRSR